MTEFWKPKSRLSATPLHVAGSITPQEVARRVENHFRSRIEEWAPEANNPDVFYIAVKINRPPNGFGPFFNASVVPNGSGYLDEWTLLKNLGAFRSPDTREFDFPVPRAVATIPIDGFHLLLSERMAGTVLPNICKLTQTPREQALRAVFESGAIARLLHSVPASLVAEGTSLSTHSLEPTHIQMTQILHKKCDELARLNPDRAFVAGFETARDIVIDALTDAIDDYANLEPSLIAVSLTSRAFIANRSRDRRVVLPGSMRLTKLGFAEIGDPAVDLARWKSLADSGSADQDHCFPDEFLNGYGRDAIDAIPESRWKVARAVWLFDHFTRLERRSHFQHQPPTANFEPLLRELDLALA